MTNHRLAIQYSFCIKVAILLIHAHRFQFKGKCGETLPPALAPHPSEETA